MDDMKTEEQPRTENAGARAAIFWAILAVVAVGCIVWWVTRDPDDKSRMRDQAADFINENLKDTPIAGLGDIVRKSPPPLPPGVLTPPTEAGTLSGRVVEGTVGSPVDLSPETGLPGVTPQLQLDQGGAALIPPATPQFSSEPLPPVSEDSRLGPDYLRELSQWLADRYKPGHHGGSLGISAQSLNNLFGVTIAQQTKGGRASLLRYVLQPSMITGLYNLYINKFMEDLGAAARRRGFDQEQTRQFELALGGRALLFAAALEGALAVPNLPDRLENIEKMAQNVVDLNAQLASVISELDELRQQKAGTQQISAVQMRVDGITARYRRAMDDQRLARDQLIALIRQHSGQTLDDDGLLFLAAWVQRRMAENPGARDSLKACAQVMRDLARRCSRSQE